MRELKLLVASDIHGSETAHTMLRELDRSSEHDLLVICGDFTTYGSVGFTENLLGSTRRKVLAVPGNCDTPEISEVLERHGCSLHGRREKVQGWDFFGFGGAAITSHQMPFEIEEDVIEETLRSIAVRGGVMVTHMPPFGINDHGRAGHSAGSRGILRVVKEYEPVLVLSGHIHEARGMQVEGPTTCLNPGPAAKGFYATVQIGERVRCQLHDWSAHSPAP